MWITTAHEDQSFFFFYCLCPMWSHALTHWRIHAHKSHEAANSCEYAANCPVKKISSFTPTDLFWQGKVTSVLLFIPLSPCQTRCKFFQHTQLDVMSRARVCQIHRHLLLQSVAGISSTGTQCSLSFSVYRHLLLCGCLNSSCLYSYISVFLTVWETWKPKHLRQNKCTH